MDPKFEAAATRRRLNCSRGDISRVAFQTIRQNTFCAGFARQRSAKRVINIDNRQFKTDSTKQFRLRRTISLEGTVIVQVIVRQICKNRCIDARPL